MIGQMLLRRARWSVVERVFVVLASALFGTVAQGAAIFRVSETTVPGDVVNVIGSGFRTASVPYILDIDSPSRTYPLEVLTRTANVIQARLPLNVTGTAWRVFVAGDVPGTNSIDVNAARIVRFDRKKAAPGDVLRIFGRNFVLPTAPGVRPHVVFLYPGGAQREATVYAATPLMVTVKVPLDLPVNVRVLVSVRSGPSAKAVRAVSPDYLATNAKGADSFGLGIDWASDFTAIAARSINVRTDKRLKPFRAVGNGIADDTKAINLAIAYMKQAGGGVVYVPAGTYRVDDGAVLHLSPNVVIRGDGPKTVLQYGYRFGPTVVPGSDYWLQIDGDRAGLLSLAIQNLNGNGVPNGGIRTKVGGVGRPSRFFMKNVDLDMGNGQAMYFVAHDRMLFDGCTFNCTSVANAPFYWSGSNDVVFRNNAVRYRVGRIHFQFNDDGIVQNNTFTRDTSWSVPGAVESGGIETTCSKRLLVLDNVFDNVGTFMRTAERDGEILLSQDFLGDFRDLGTVSSATATTLTDASKSWSTAVPWSDNNVLYGGPGVNRAMVAIVAGTGMGQWRNVVSHTAHAVTVDQPWQVVPDSTSRYAIGQWSNYQQMIVGNTMTNSYAGIVVYHGGWDVYVRDNVLLNAGYIALRADDRMNMWGYRQHTLLWNSSVVGNRVVDQSGVVPAQIIGFASDIYGSQSGNLILGLELRNNTLQALVPCPSIVNYFNYGDSEGFWNKFWNQGDHTATDLYSYQGLLMMDNTTQGIASPFNSLSVDPYTVSNTAIRP